jgi:hypothetical protein
MKIRWMVGAALAAALQAAPALAQDKPMIPPFLQEPQDPKAKMIELFQKVETRLGEIDKLLYDASTGEAKLAKVSESGIADLLKGSRSRGEEVLSGIDEILKIARENGGQSGGT